jgi:DNA-binding XRE family transcriptional regulator
MYAIAYMLSRANVRYSVTSSLAPATCWFDSLCAIAYPVPVSPLRLRVKELREALGLTQAELAERANVRRATVNRIENAHVTAIDMDVLERLAEALGVEPGFLVVRVAGSRKASR